MTPDEIREPADLDGLDKDGLIAFLESEHEDKIELWNAWREATKPSPFEWAEVDLQGANLAFAHLEGADLRRAHLEGATLGLAHLEGADLSGAHLEGADLRWARLEGAYLSGAHLEGANLGWTHLEGASLGGAHLEGANLREAHLEGASLSGAYLEGAGLCRAYLRDVVLSSVTSLRGVRLYQTYFWGVLSLRYQQFLDEKGNSTIWEESEGRFREAKDVYKTLKGYFEDAGDYEGANWAYVREQVMEKLVRVPRNPRWLRRFYPHWRDKFGNEYCDPDFIEWLRLEFAEKIANYGDSLLRPALWLLTVIVGFALAYWFFGMVTATPGCGYEELQLAWREGCAPTRNLLHGLWFSLGAMTTLDIGYLQPYLPAADVLRPIETLLGIALTGLFGFVLGNRLRYS